MDQESSETQGSQEQPEGQGQEPATADVETVADLSGQGQEPAGKSKTFDEDYVRGLRKEAADARTRAREAEERLQEIADREKTDAEKLAAKAQKNEARAVEAEAKLMRYEVAGEKELDLRAAQFLTGTTREEIESSADVLGSLIAERKAAATPSLDGGARETAKKRGTPEEEHNQFLERVLRREA